MPVRADALHNVATALDYAGFDARGSHNPLSGGIDLLINRQFNGNFFDFGGTELALQGPVSLQMSTGGRLIPEFEVAFSTAANSRTQPSALNFSYVSDIGPQSTAISGSMLVDGKFSINALGFYDLTLTSSSRNTVERDGIVTDTNTFDSDVGPITVSGNIFADALAVLVDPLFEEAGRENPFSDVSKLIDFNLDGMVDSTMMSGVVPNTDAIRSFDALHPAGSQTNQNVAVVPEPTALVLLLLGLPVIINRTWRVR